MEKPKNTKNQKDQKDSMQIEEDFQDLKITQSPKQPKKRPQNEIIIDNMDMVFEEDFDIQEENQIIEEEEDSDVEKNENYKSDMDTFNSGVFNKEEIPEYITDTFNFHKDSICSVKCNKIYPNIIASGGTDDSLYITDMKENKTILTEKFKDSISLLDFSYDGTLLASYCIDDCITIYKKSENGENFKKAHTLETPKDEITVK